MIVTVQEFASDITRYLDLMDKEEIIITKEGHCVGKLVGVKSGIVDSLVGVIADDGMSLDEIRTERLKKYEYRS